MLFDNNKLEGISKGLETDKKEFFKINKKNKKIMGSFFTKWYDFYFDKIKDRKLNILEIGVANGDSLKMWKILFVNSKIYGIDIDKNKKKLENNPGLEGVNIFIGDQSSKYFLKKVCQNIKNGFDIIIDDGSHITGHQIFSFEYLFPKLNKGGIYVIEDVHTSYIKEFRKGSCKNTINYFKKKIDDINVNGKIKKYYNNYNILNETKNKLSYYEKNIEGIHFYPDICFIFKKKVC